MTVQRALINDSDFFKDKALMTISVECKKLSNFIDKLFVR